MASTGEAPKKNRGPAAAAHNRRALIDAARDLFAEQGFSVPFSAVARRAGVGQASLYRHFPDKVALGVAVFEENLKLIEERPVGLHDFLVSIADQARVSASLAEELGERLVSIVTAMIARENLPEHVTAADVQAAVSMVAFHTAAAPTPDAADRAIAIVERGLRG
jgi:AcrR family transcriptional regulator